MRPGLAGLIPWIGVWAAGGAVAGFLLGRGGGSHLPAWIAVPMLALVGAFGGALVGAVVRPVVASWGFAPRLVFAVLVSAVATALLAVLLGIKPIASAATGAVLGAVSLLLSRLP